MRAVIFLFGVFVSFAIHSRDIALNGSWIVSISNLDGMVITKMKVRFLNKKAESCLGGDWKKLEVVSYETSDENFFPVKDSLSYDLKGDELIIGRNQICDAYLHLDGKYDAIRGQGDYIRFGWGTEALGHFFLFRESAKDS